MQFAEMIKGTRLQARLSQRGLAEQLITAQKPEGVWATYIGQIEKGEKVPSDEVCIKLAEVLELDSSEVLVAAYEAKAGSEEGRALFAKMARSLADPVVRQLLASKEPLEPALLDALADVETQALLSDRAWLDAISKARKKQKKRDVLAWLSLGVTMDDKQWGALTAVMGTMGLDPPT
jgi:transcriptional regulator with XRE-family HTH domain